MKKHLWNFIFSRWAAFIHDMLWVPTSLLLAVWLRFNLDIIPQPYLASTVRLLVIALPVQSLLFWKLGLYRGFWHFASIPDLTRIIKTVLLGTIIVTMTDAWLFRLDSVPRSVLLLYPLLLTVGLTGPRILYRWLKDHRLRFKRKAGRRTLIIGAGSAGELLLRDLLHREEYHPVAFVDDDTKKHGREIHKIRIVGPIDRLNSIIKQLSIEIALLAIPSATRATMQQVAKECGKAGIPCETLPSIVELSDKQINIDRLRPVSVEDLLGRDTVNLDTNAISGYLRGKRILITGGGGSIGSELCRQIAQKKPEQLIILEHSEYNLYKIEQELRVDHPQLNLGCVLGDIKNSERVEWVFSRHRPDVVFHAAAYKHVPMLETNPAEGVLNNIFGTMTIADAADKFGVSRFVLVSTDKAVNPANVMGTTKRTAELYCQNLNLRSKTRFITTRFGNVLGSAGSVVPLFSEQIRNGGPVTVTHPEISRYFMTIPEAVALILQAGSMGNGGEIFVLDMGEPVLIRDLAEQMIRLSGLKPDKEIKIIYTGLRPGEKLHEELFHTKENLKKTSHAKLHLAGSRQVDWDWLVLELSELKQASHRRDIMPLLLHLKNIVPEFSGMPHEN